MVFFQKYYFYYFYNKNEFKNNQILIIITCIFLATKTCNQLINLDELLFLMTDLFSNKINLDENLNKIKETIFSIEYDILDKINFELNVELPYKYLIMMKSLFDNRKDGKLLFEYCCRFINDSFIIFPVCLIYNPLKITIGAVNLVNNIYGMDLDKEYFKKFCDENLVDFSLEEIELISDLILSIYKNCGKKEKENKEKLFFNLNFALK